MSTFSFTRRGLVSAAAAALTLSALPALAQTPIKFQLDWRFEGPSALFLAADAKGHYKAAGLDVKIDAGNGSGGGDGGAGATKARITAANGRN